MIYGIYRLYWYIYIHDIIYWWITYVWNINRIKRTMDFQYNLRVWGRRNMDEGMTNVFFLWRGDFKHFAPINAFLRLHYVALLLYLFCGFPWTYPCVFHVVVSAVSPHLRQAMQELDVAIRVDPVDKFVEIMSHIAIDLPSAASFGTKVPTKTNGWTTSRWTQKKDKRIHPVDVLWLVGVLGSCDLSFNIMPCVFLKGKPHIVYSILHFFFVLGSCDLSFNIMRACFWKGNQI